MKKYKIIPDEVLKSLDESNDVLGNDIYVDELYRVIKSTSMTNTTETIGLFGEWGSGKSSVVSSVITKIEKQKLKVNDKRIKFIEYDAWKYSEYDFKESFLMKIAQENKKGTDIEKELFEERTSTKYDFVFWRTIIIFTFIALFIVFFALFMDIDDLINKPVETLIVSIVLIGVELLLLSVVNLIFKQDSSTIRNHFSQFDFNNKFKKIMNGSLFYQVIIIDNLDRCSETYSVSILDFIKGFLTNDSGNYVFILPVDETKIIEELEKTRNYSLKDSKEFLSKIFDYSIVMEKSRKINLYSIVHKINGHEKFNFSSRLMSLISDFHGDTPRQIIKIINLINSKRELIEESINRELEENELNMVGVITIIREKWVLLYHILIKNPELIENLYTNIKHSKITGLVSKDTELLHFIQSSRKISCNNPLMYIHNLANDAVYNIDIMRQIQFCTFGDDIIEKDSINYNHIEYITDQVIQEYVINRNSLNLIEVFVSTNRIIKILDNRKYLAKLLLQSLNELYEILLKEYQSIDYLDKFHKDLIDKYNDSICHNAKDHELMFMFQQLLQNSNLINDIDIINIFLKNNFQIVSEIDGTILSSIIKNVIISSKDGDIKYLEKDIKKYSEYIKEADLGAIIKSNKMTYIRLLTLVKTKDMEKYTQEIIKVATISNSEMINVNYDTITNKLDRLMLINTIFHSKSENMIVEITKVIQANNLLIHLNSLVSQFIRLTRTELEISILKLVSEIIDCSIINNNYELNSPQLNYIQTITHQSYISIFEEILIRLINKIKYNDFNERLIITTLFTTGFKHDQYIEKLFDFYNNSNKPLIFISDIINNQQINNTLSFQNLTLNTDGFVDHIIDMLYLLTEEKTIELLKLVKFPQLAKFAKLQDLGNKNKEYRRIVISTIQTFNDYQVAKRIIDEQSVITNFEDKLIEIINKTIQITLLGDIHDDKNVIMKRKIQQALYDKVIEITGTFDKERYNRIDIRKV